MRPDFSQLADVTSVANAVEVPEISDKVVLSIGIIDLIKSELPSWGITIIVYAMAIFLLLSIIYGIYNLCLKILERWKVYTRRVNELKFANTLESEIRNAFDEVKKRYDGNQSKYENNYEQLILYSSILKICEESVNLAAHHANIKPIKTNNNNNIIDFMKVYRYAIQNLISR